MFKVSSRRFAGWAVRAALFASTILTSAVALSQPTQVWATINHVPNPAYNQYTTRSYTDATGNTFQVGAIDSGGTGQNMMLTRYSPTGQVVYSVKFGPALTNMAEGASFVRSDASENAYVSEYEGGNSFGRTQKYDPNGNLLWDVPFSNYAQPGTFQVDASGNSYTAVYQYDVNFENPTIHVLKLDSSGNTVYDVNFPFISQYDLMSPRSALAADGSLFICGYYSAVSGGINGWLLKVNPDGSLGFEKTYVTGGAQDSDYNAGVYLDPSGSITMFGTYGDSATNDVQAGVIHYDSAGNFVWLKRFGLNIGFNDMAIDASNNIFVGGSLTGNAVTKKLDSSGNTLWTQTFNNIGSPPSARVDFVMPDGSGGVYSQITCNAIGMGVVAYDSAGALVWPTTGIYNQGGLFYSAGGPYTYCNGFFRDAAGDFYLGGQAVPASGPRLGTVAKFSSTPQVASLTFSPTTLTNNAATTGTITLNRPALVGGANVSLTMGSNTTGVPLTINIPQGQTVGTFTATGHNTFYNPVQGSVKAIVGTGTTVNTTFTVNPPNSASFISQNTPTAMTSGQHYLVTVQYKNLGLLTWDAAHLYKLQSRNLQNNTTWGSNRMTLTNAPVAPNGTGIFTINALAPATAGTYNFQWIPIEDSVGIAFGSASPNVAVVVTKATDAAQFVSNTGATTVFAGADFFSTNTMKNVGTSTWTTATLYSMMSQSPANNTTWNGNRIPIPGAVPSVAPGASVTFTKQCTAPITPGTYTMQWQCNKNGVAFGDTTPLLTMTVVQGPDNSQWLSTTGVPTSIGPGKTFTGVISMKNLGTATWTAGPYTLVPIGSNNFGIASVAAVSTAQNATDAFSALFTAPATPGTYTFQWRVAHSGTKFGQSSPSITIVVSADAAQFVSRSGATTVNAGADFFSTYSMKNTGTTTWTSAAGYYLSIFPAASTTWTANRINLPASVAPGASFTNAALCTAPIVPGTYTQQWQMSKGGVLFGATTPIQSIIVVNGADNAQFISQVNVPTTIVHGTTFTATITMKNIGTGSWSAGTHSLTSVGTNNFGVASIPAGTVAPGANGTFSTLFTAPAAPGTYTFKWRMQHTATKFGQPTASITITVT